jgi:D-alanyl-lipoteichoic acid acyltransferase DltB (MBOAT superfamily)
MLFNSLAFALFFPLVTFGYFLLRPGHRWWWLLAASCIFYMYFRPAYILILALTIGIDYAAGLLMERCTDRKVRRRWLAASLIANIGILAFFKYWDFLDENLASLTGWTGTPLHLPALDVVLPVGLSFHTFQAMSYTFDVYYGRQKAERHLGIYALYVMFYPQLVAGPIERPGQLLPQFREVHTVDYRRISRGLVRMLWGLFKKMVIADRLSLFVDPVFREPQAYGGITIVWAVLFFSIQIYADFSGYCDIALGAAQVMGFRLMENFRHPYFSASFREFWTRWHISLSQWFRDFVYIPLGGNRVPFAKEIRNLLLVFALSGLWHGASWTFVVWGVLHGLFLIAERLLFPHGRQERLANRIITFAFVSLAWVFFRADSFNTAMQIFSGLVRPSSGWIGLPLITPQSFITNLLLIGLLLLTEWKEWHAPEHKRETPSRRLAAYGWHAALAVLILLYGVFEAQSFIYFQF